MNTTTLENWWNSLAARERRSLGAAAWLVAGAAVWWIALAPAIETLGRAPAQHRSLDAQLQRMLALKAEAQSLQGLARAGGDDPRAVLETSLKKAFGAAASLQLAGDRASVTLKAVPAQALANWLVDVRASARLLPAEARLARPTAPGAPDLWDATLVLSLPAR